MRTIKKCNIGWKPEWWHNLRVECPACGFVGLMEADELDVNCQFTVQVDRGSIGCTTCGQNIHFRKD